MSDIKNGIKDLIEFSELWWGSAQEGEPIAQDEILLVKDLIAALKSHSTTIESQKEEIAKLKYELEVLEKRTVCGVTKKINLSNVKRKR